MKPVGTKIGGLFLPTENSRVGTVAQDFPERKAHPVKLHVRGALSRCRAPFRLVAPMPAGCMGLAVASFWVQDDYGLVFIISTFTTRLRLCWLISRDSQTTFLRLYLPAEFRRSGFVNFAVAGKIEATPPIFALVPRLIPIQRPEIPGF